MANPKPHCSVDYHAFGPVDFENKGHLIGTGIYGNAGTFTAPPYTQTIYDAAIENVHLKYEAYRNGGAEQKGPYLIARAEATTIMDKTGEYVDGLPGVDMAMIILAGFTPTKTGETDAVVPDAPVIEKVDRETTTWLKPQCHTVHGATFYGCFVLEQPLGPDITFYNGQISITPGASPIPSNIRLVITKGRFKEVPGLTKGRDYWIYFYAGNAAGISTLSEPVQVMCN
jgi:hypothetical protein